MVYAGLLGYWLVEPTRETKADDPASRREGGGDPWSLAPTRAGSLAEKVLRILTNPSAALLLLVFVGATSWRPLF